MLMLVRLGKGKRNKGHERGFMLFIYTYTQTFKIFCILSIS